MLQLFIPRKAEAAISPSKAKTVRQDSIDFSFLCRVGRVVAVKVGRCIVQVDSRRHNILRTLVCIKRS
jgi:hypothetical protein